MTEHEPKPLDCDVSMPEAARPGATVAVLLHGRGSHKGDLQGLAPLLPARWALVTPQAPHPGAPWGYGPGAAWYRYLEDDRVVAETLTQSLDALDAFLAGLPTRLGFAPGRIVLGGFSQGGTVSMAYALSRPKAVSAALNFSGFLAASVNLAQARAAPPIFWGHGTHDVNIPLALAVRGRKRLAEAGAEVMARDYQIGHWIVPEEIADAVAAVGGA